MRRFYSTLTPYGQQTRTLGLNPRLRENCTLRGVIESRKARIQLYAMAGNPPLAGFDLFKVFINDQWIGVLSQGKEDPAQWSANDDIAGEALKTHAPTYTRGKKRFWGSLSPCNSRKEKTGGAKSIRLTLTGKKAGITVYAQTTPEAGELFEFFRNGGSGGAGQNAQGITGDFLGSLSVSEDGAYTWTGHEAAPVLHDVAIIQAVGDGETQTVKALDIEHAARQVAQKLTGQRVELAVSNQESGIHSMFRLNAGLLLRVHPDSSLSQVCLDPPA